MFWPPKYYFVKSSKWYLHSVKFLCSRTKRMVKPFVYLYGRISKKNARHGRNSILPFLQIKKEIKPLEFVSNQCHIKFSVS